MSFWYKILCKIRQKYLSLKLTKYGGDGFIDFTAKFTNSGNIKIGKSCIIVERVWLASLDNGREFGLISVGDNVVISRDTIVSSAFQVSIGNGVTLGPHVSIYDNNHGFDECNRSVMEQGLKGKAVTIGDYAWIGLNSVILPGVSVGQGAIVGAGSVVTKSIDEFKIAVGNPARVIGDRRSVSGD